MLRGELTESGVLYRPGDWSFRPAHAHRTGLTAPGGALVVALFDAPPRWLPGPGTPSPVGPRVHLPSTTLPGSDGLQLRPGTRLCAAPEPPHSTAVLLTEDGRDWYWRQAPAGERLAPVRTLIRIPSPQERRIPGIATPGYALLEGGPLELPRLYPLLPGVPPPERLHIPYYARTQHYEQIARQVCVDGLDRPVYRWAYSTAIAE
ncbi:DUF5988 family protein [Streptomyces sp. NBC_01477]|uniref:DUF5988 family protein n=1 Tax=Streptomyces sp. NBC_01477 TaxID=2976015 RepID=UPI002E32F023|nr:DUF5988 family protein [Streptomyces sp. NBC_01477]